MAYLFAGLLLGSNGGLDLDSIASQRAGSVPRLVVATVNFFQMILIREVLDSTERLQRQLNAAYLNTGDIKDAVIGITQN